MAKKATDADENEDYKEALQYYEHAIQYFLHASKCKSTIHVAILLVCFLDEIHGDKAKESVRSRIKSYLDRAEQLKEHLRKEKRKGKKMVEGGSSKSKKKSDKKYTPIN